MTPAQAAKKFEQMAVALPRELVKAEQATQKEALAEAQKMSSGGNTPPETLGWYAVRNNQGSRFSFADVNVQTGALLSDWKASPTVITPDGIAHAVINDNPIAAYVVFGTRALIARRIDERVIDRIAYQRVKRIESAINKALK